ncbi:MAG: helix-turn-helix transcriptional regulator [Candidatus Aerophobetes bacterium]|nr:helix-turn-helix transcriptional regulator [Candidatus Aerophobetes bacterium]
MKKNSRLKVFRFIKGKSQDEISHEVGISQSKLSRIERGYIVPSEEEKKSIAKALEMTVEELFEPTLDQKKRLARALGAAEDWPIPDDKE